MLGFVRLMDDDCRRLRNDNYCLLEVWLSPIGFTYYINM